MCRKRVVAANNKTHHVSSSSTTEILIIDNDDSSSSSEDDNNKEDKNARDCKREQSTPAMVAAAIKSYPTIFSAILDQTSFDVISATDYFQVQKQVMF